MVSIILTLFIFTYERVSFPLFHLLVRTACHSTPTSVCFRDQCSNKAADGSSTNSTNYYSTKHYPDKGQVPWYCYHLITIPSETPFQTSSQPSLHLLLHHLTILTQFASRPPPVRSTEYQLPSLTQMHVYTSLCSVVLSKLNLISLNLSVWNLW